MSTRGLIAVTSQKQFKIAQYCQSDCHPAGVGIEVLNFIRKCDIDKFREQLKSITFFTQKELKGESGREIDKLSHIQGDYASKILDAVYEGRITRLLNSRLFSIDSLWCEWIFLLDLDKSTYEIYRGFNVEPITPEDRFYSKQPSVTVIGKARFYPAKLIKTFEFAHLPMTHEFVLECNKASEHIIKPNFEELKG
jgi:hypothetical protein